MYIKPFCELVELHVSQVITTSAPAFSTGGGLDMDEGTVAPGFGVGGCLDMDNN